jgi:hypothetical protein
MINFKSKSDLDSDKTKFALLKSDDYELIVTGIEKGTQLKYMSKDEEEDIVNITFDVGGLRDGGEPKDDEDNSAIGRKVFFTARPNSIGFMRDGTPAKTRQFVAYALGVENIEDDFELEEWEELAGNTVYAEIVQYTNQKGKKSNKIVRFLKPPKTERVKDSEIPIVEDDN